MVNKVSVITEPFYDAAPQRGAPFDYNDELGRDSYCMEESVMIWKFLSSRIDRILRI